jgi:Mg/Co/Ni transporter MgtE
MKRGELSEFEQSMLKEMNKRAMLLVKLEEYLNYHKIPMDKRLIDSLPDEELSQLVTTWSPERQEELRKTLKFETESQNDHTINGSGEEDKVS